MGIEYQIKFGIAPDYDPANLVRLLPSPIDESTRHQIYDYAIGIDGFYFIDHLVDSRVASLAFRRLVDEALLRATSVEIVEP